MTYVNKSCYFDTTGPRIFYARIIKDCLQSGIDSMQSITDKCKAVSACSNAVTAACAYFKGGIIQKRTCFSACINIHRYKWSSESVCERWAESRVRGRSVQVIRNVLPSPRVFKDITCRRTTIARRVVECLSM